MSTKGKILVIEDDKSIAMDINMLLTAEGYQVVRAENGLEALKVLAAMQSLPNLILLDIMMPVMDGWEFREAQQKDSRLSQIPVILMTAEGHAGQKAEKMTIGNYLQKPFDIDALLQMILTVRTS